MRRFICLCFFIVLCGGAIASETPLNPPSAGPSQSTEPGAPNTVQALKQKPGVDVAGNIVQLIMGLLIVLVLIFVFAWLGKNYGGFRSSAGGAVKVVATMSMGTREKLVVVQVGEEQLLIGVSPGGISTLHVLPVPIEHDIQSQILPESFVSVLRTAIRGRQQ